MNNNTKRNQFKSRLLENPIRLKIVEMLYYRDLNFNGIFECLGVRHIDLTYHLELLNESEIIKVVENKFYKVYSLNHQNLPNNERQL
jgi:DNA-binding transcriptional ArsR family regulator